MFQVCRHYLMPLLHQLPLDRSLIESSSALAKQVLVEKTPPSPMGPPSMISNTPDYLMSSSASGSLNDLKSGLKNDEEFLGGKENINYTIDPMNGEDPDPEPPAVVLYFVDPFTMGPNSENGDLMRMTTLGLLRCFLQMLPNMGETLKNNISVQLVSPDSILAMSKYVTCMFQHLLSQYGCVLNLSNRVLNMCKNVPKKSNHVPNLHSTRLDICSTCLNMCSISLNMPKTFWNIR